MWCYIWFLSWWSCFNVKNRRRFKKIWSECRGEMANIYHLYLLQNTTLEFYNNKDIYSIVTLVLEVFDCEIMYSDVGCQDRTNDGGVINVKTYSNCWFPTFYPTNAVCVCWWQTIPVEWALSWVRSNIWILFI